MPRECQDAALTSLSVSKRGGLQAKHSTQEKSIFLDVFFNKLWCKKSEQKRSFKDLFESLAEKLLVRPKDLPGRTFTSVPLFGASLQPLVKGEMFSLLRSYFDALEAFERENKPPVFASLSRTSAVVSTIF